MATREITKDNLTDTVSGNDIVLLDFWAGWCRPCVSFAPIFEEASDKHPDVVFGKIDTEAQRELAAEFEIASIPTLMAFREGVMVFAQPGALRGPDLEELVAAVKELDMAEVHAQAAQQTPAAERADR